MQKKLKISRLTLKLSLMKSFFLGNKSRAKKRKILIGIQQ